MTKFKGYAYGGVTLAAVVLTLVSFVSLASSEQPTATLSALVSRAQIEDMLAGYYALFGGAGRGFESYYTENGVLEVNGIVRRGRKPIDDLYKSIPPDHGKINVTFTNLRIAVRGNTAAYDLVWTEFLSETPTTVPHILEQGSDHGELVKSDVRWLFSCRVVTNDGGLPPDLEKYYRQRGAAPVCE